MKKKMVKNQDEHYFYSLDIYVDVYLHLVKT